MAKKRKAKEEEKEKPIFVPPEFDEREFMENEIKNSRISVFVFLYSVLFAFLSWAITLFGEWQLALFLGFIALITMANFLEKLNLDLSHLAKKDWLGNYGMFIFAWLGVWIVLCNPPFSDMAPPDIESLTITTDYYNGTWNQTSYYMAFLPKTHEDIWRENDDARINAGLPLNITMKVTDNYDVKGVSLWIHNVSNPEVIEQSGNRISLKNWGGERWSVEMLYDSPATYFMFIFVEDVNGNSSLVREDSQGKALSFTIH